MHRCAESLDQFICHTKIKGNASFSILITKIRVDRGNTDFSMIIDLC